MPKVDSDMTFSYSCCCDPKYNANNQCMGMDIACGCTQTFVDMRVFT